jgi:hypothetical protein
VRSSRSRWALLTVVVAVLAGCGSSQSPVQIAASTAARPGAAVNASALAFARGVNLRASDMPEMEAVGGEAPGPPPEAVALVFAQCAHGVSPARISLEMRSVLLSLGGESDRRLLRSRVTLMPSEKLARHKLAAFGSARGARCELRDGGISTSRLELTLPGGAHALGLRAVAPSRHNPAQPRGYHDILAFVVGQAEVALTATGFSRPVPTPIERRLLGVMYRRAIAERSEL